MASQSLGCSTCTALRRPSAGCFGSTWLLVFHCPRQRRSLCRSSIWPRTPLAGRGLIACGDGGTEDHFRRATSTGLSACPDLLLGLPVQPPQRHGSGSMAGRVEAFGYRAKVYVPEMWAEGSGRQAGIPARQDGHRWPVTSKSTPAATSESTTSSPQEGVSGALRWCRAR